MCSTKSWPCFSQQPLCILYIPDQVSAGYVTNLMNIIKSPMNFHFLLFGDLWGTSLFFARQPVFHQRKGAYFYLRYA